MASSFGFKLIQKSSSSASDVRKEHHQDNSESKEKKERKHKKSKEKPKLTDTIPSTPERDKKEKKLKKERTPSSTSLSSSQSSSRSHRKLRSDSAQVLSLDEQEKIVQDLLAAELERRQCGDEVRQAGRQRRDAALMAALAKEEERMIIVQKSAEKMKEMTEKLKSLAESYEAHRLAIASALEPVKEKTERLQLVQRNAEATRVSLENMLQLTGLPDQLEPIAKQGPGNDVATFLQRLEEAKAAAALFESARHWRAGNAALQRLKPLVLQMTASLDIPFARLLAKCSSAADQKKFPDDPSSRPQLLSNKRVEQLRRLILHLSAHPGSLQYQTDYTDSRCKFVATTLKKISGNTPAAGIDDGLAYIRGSHKIILVMRIVLQLCIHEEWLASSVLPHTAYETSLNPILDTAVDALCGEGELITNKDRNTETILSAMDACQSLSLLLPKFNTALPQVGSGKALREVNDLYNRLASACKRVLTDTDLIVKRGFRNAEIPADGTVHEQTVNTLSLLRRLVEYQSLVSTLLASEYHTSRSPVKEFYSTILAELRTQLQERARKVKPVLAALFLLNNFHFIAQAARGELRALLGDADLADLESLQANARSNYRQGWNETLEYLWEPKNWQNNSAGKTAIKKKFKGFNSSLESLFAAQRHYAVPDVGLRAQLRADIKAVLMPLYENFLQKYGSVDFSKNKGKYVKFSAQTLSSVIDRFFEDEPLAAKKGGLARISNVSAIRKYV